LGTETLHPFEYPHNELVLSMEQDKPGGLTVGDIKKRIAEVHGIPLIAVSLFRNAERTDEYLNLSEHVSQPSDPEGLKIYWAFIGDAPSNWLSKRADITPTVDNVLLQVTDQLNTCTFFLEKDFKWKEEGMSKDQKKRDWLNINGLPYADSQPLLPISIMFNHETKMAKYTTSKDELEYAYFNNSDKLNLSWKKTRDYILQRISNLRTDKMQYERNLMDLENNDKILRNQIQHISGKLFPPFPDTGLYSSIFHSATNNNPPDLIIKALMGSIEQNTVYYHQELGKYNQLKKEECHLIEKYQQIQTRMKLWIVRERIRLMAWELMYSKAYEDDDVIVPFRDIYETTPYPPHAVGHRKRAFQCIDFCQCEAGCSLLIQNKK